MSKLNKVKALLLLITFLSITSTIQSQTVTPWMTTGDQSKLIQQQPTVSFGANSGSNPTTITLNTGQTFQTMEGFGWALTEGSCELISAMSAAQQNALLNDMFNPTTGLSSSAMRIGLGASDLSSSDYTYSASVDLNMTNFSLAGPDLTYLIPIIKKILLINPNIKILATPWTPPIWMKSNNSYRGGTLLPQYYNAYGKYFVKYVQAMASQGITIWGITPQNEPENPNNDPSLAMNSTEQKNFINQELGPQMVAAGLGSVKIIAFDHNCDNTAYPIDVLNNSTYVDGAAFHLYAGNISAMSTVHNATNKNVYFTEQYTGSPSNFSGDFGFHMQNVVIGSTNNWSKTVFEWNLASDPNLGPHTPGPGTCTTCLGAVTINGSNYTKNVSYYIIGQISKFVKAGAIRVSALSSSSTVNSVGFRNPDGSVALLVYNANAAATAMKIVNGSNAFDYTIPAASAVTFNWSNGPAVAVTGVSVSPTTGSLAVNSTIQLTETVAPANATNKNVTWTSSNNSVATVNSSGLVSGVSAGSATITVTTQDGNKTATSSLTVSVISVTGVSVSPVSASLFPNETKQLTATVLPNNASNKSVTWSSSNTLIANVSTNGLVTPVSSGTATITVTTIDGNKTATAAFTIKGQEAYNNIISTIPGVIQAENYDLGGQNIAYNDMDATNNGNQYRTTEGVDVVDISGTSGYTIGWTADGEWLEYTTNVNAGNYAIIATVASPNSGKQLRIKLDGITLATITVPNTGDYGLFQNITIPNITFTGGNNKVLRLEILGGEFNIDKIAIQSILGVNDNAFNKNEALFVYPNPTTNYLKIKSEYLGDTNIDIYTVTGELVLENKFISEGGNNEKTIDVSLLQDGLYFVKITDSKGSYLRKIIKQ